MEIRLIRDPAKGDPVTMSQVTMSCHSGTHIDAPRHFFLDGAGIDELRWIPSSDRRALSR